jgi:hypothetical protein
VKCLIVLRRVPSSFAGIVVNSKCSISTMGKMASAGNLLVWSAGRRRGIMGKLDRSGIISILIDRDYRFSYICPEIMRRVFCENSDSPYPEERMIFSQDINLFIDDFIGIEKESFETFLDEKRIEIISDLKLKSLTLSLKQWKAVKKGDHGIRS